MRIIPGCNSRLFVRTGQVLLQQRQSFWVIEDEKFDKDGELVSSSEDEEASSEEEDEEEEEEEDEESEDDEQRRRRLYTIPAEIRNAVRMATR